MDKKYKILVCPLGWGLGHAGRMIPVITWLKGRGHHIIIGADDKHFAFFNSELPGNDLIKFPGFKPVYSRFLPAYTVLLFQIPLLLYHIVHEHFKLKKIIRDNSIDILISDNRFGLWNKNIKTVYVTHMPLIPFPRLFRCFEFIGIWLHRAIIRKYTLCFIPDLPGSINLTGRLSHGLRLPDNTKFIGILSRFISQDPVNIKNASGVRHNCAIISGPPPQNGILRKKLTLLLQNRQPKTIILGGKPDNSSAMTRSGNIIYYGHLSSGPMKETILQSENIIARAGYSTIMDLVCLRKSALLIPTPGQTEQEYLSTYLSDKNWFSYISQKNINDDFKFPMPLSTEWCDDLIARSRMFFKKALNELLDK